MIEGGFSMFRNKRVLLLQGPIGPFFRRLSLDLEQAGAQVFKINFNGGDWLFYPSGAFNYCGTMSEWPAYLEELLDQLHIDVMMLFGDCRPIHVPVHEIAHQRGITIGVFEEGYVRPDYITLEELGVNGRSAIPRTPVFYLNHPSPSIDPTIPVGKTFWFTAMWAVMYYFVSGLLKPFFSHYRHHRPLTWLEGLPWLRSAWRKWFYTIKEHGISAQLTSELSGRFFLIPLQVHNDSQLHTHSDFDSVTQFIKEVMTSFAHYAPRNTVLVIKHHPMDRGYSDHAQFIALHIKKLELQGRCLYIHDQHLPTLLTHTRGVVVINSTVGLSALFHGAAVKVCGNALYDINGLTYREPLAGFWLNAHRTKPSRQLFINFHNYLIRHTQLNGSFYRRLPIIGSTAGLRWTSKITPATVKQPVEDANNSNPISKLK